MKLTTASGGVMFISNIPRGIRARAGMGQNGVPDFSFDALRHDNIVYS